MKMPLVRMSDENTKKIVQNEIDTISRIIGYYVKSFCAAFEAKEETVVSLIDELFKNTDVMNYCLLRSIEDTNAKCFQTMKTLEDYVAAPGTILNGAFLYVVIRYFKLKNIFESGTASGFYTSFLLAALIKNGADFNLDTVDLLSLDDVGKNILFDSPNVHVYKATNSLDFLKAKNDKKEFYDLYCHDSQHTFNHMLKELTRFKKCEKDLYFCFFDDQRSQDFWSRCIKMGLFWKEGYQANLTNEPEQLGGFLQYKKVSLAA